MTIPQISDYELPRSLPANKTAWTPEPKRSVLLIHDMQRYFLRFYNEDSALRITLVENLRRLKSWARENGVPVIYTAQPHDQPPEDRALLNDMWGPGLTVADPGLQEVVSGLEPDAEDIVLTKWRYSAFQRSDLLDRMKTLGRDQLIVGGVYAHIGCLMTIADAFMHDIQAFMVADAVADFSQADHVMALNYVATRCGAVTTTSQLTEQDSPASATRDWLEKRVLQLIEDETELDPEENLIFYGLDSIQVMKLAKELKDRGVKVGFDELARVPTLNGWWTLIESKRLAA
ncbi:isochorismatase family protein [Roseibium sp. RKSG952]|uniref:isochorismatase family protein n=1 Tax=Roseibium sp. RKSG952 TaxID=2529384 RepID=UPI0012BBE400|nr:isochorismatase family protein [Roseibium sp. RKSG952]MTH96592.1 isochorismatase family protein [Roseibium sp. RKSG952]